MSDTSPGGAAHAAHDAHTAHGGVAKYLAVFFWLCVLTAISFAVGSSESLMRDAAPIGRTIMVIVSCAKALLVMLFFMHLLWESNWKYVLTIPASIMSIFLLLMLVPDIGFRGRMYSEERQMQAAIAGPDAEYDAAGDPAGAGDAHGHALNETGAAPDSAAATPEHGGAPERGHE